MYWRDQLACPEAAPITLDFGQRFRADAHLPPAANGRRPDPITLCKAPLEFINVARLDLPKVQKQRGKRVVVKGELVIGSRASGRARGHLKLGEQKVRIKSSRLKLMPARGGKPVKLKLRPKRSRDNRKVRRVLQRRNSGKIRGKIRVVLRDRHDRKVSESRKIVLRR